MLVVPLHASCPGDFAFSESYRLREFASSISKLSVLYGEEPFLSSFGISRSPRRVAEEIDSSRPSSWRVPIGKVILMSSTMSSTKQSEFRYDLVQLIHSTLHIRSRHFNSPHLLLCRTSTSGFYLRKKIVEW